VQRQGISKGQLGSLSLLEKLALVVKSNAPGVEEICGHLLLKKSMILFRGRVVQRRLPNGLKAREQNLPSDTARP